MKFTYDFKLTDLDLVKKNGLRVLSCFSGGGGSSIGYKMSGCDVVGFCEVDRKMAETYLMNLSVKHPYIMPIQKFKNLGDDLIDFYNIDILDGSPPCSSFSMIGSREKDWGKEKNYKEGVIKQKLDTLFFDFVELADNIKPKMIIAENVKGLIYKNAISYFNEIIRRLDYIGYDTNAFIVKGQSLGLPQMRERVFIVGRRKDLIKKNKPLNLFFNEKQINCNDVNVENSIGREIPRDSSLYRNWIRRKKNKKFRGYFGYGMAQYDRPCPTVLSSGSEKMFHWAKPNYVSKEFIVKCSSFPSDYRFTPCGSDYVCGMSVPPLMMHRVSSQIIPQFFDL